MRCRGWHWTAWCHLMIIELSVGLRESQWRVGKKLFQVIEDLDCLLCQKWHEWCWKVLLHASKRCHCHLEPVIRSNCDRLNSYHNQDRTVSHNSRDRITNRHTRLGLNWMQWKLDSQVLFIGNRKACIFNFPKLAIGKHGLFICSRASELNMTSFTFWSAVKELSDQKAGKVVKKFYRYLLVYTF